MNKSTEKPATCDNSTWPTRIWWTDDERLAIGMTLDRLKCESATRLIPDVELVKCLAQAQALPLERRRKLTDKQATALVAWIDSKREQQEALHWLDDEAAAQLPLASVPGNEPDELEVLTQDVKALYDRVGQLEGSVLDKIQSMLDAHYYRIEQLIGGAPSVDEKVKPAPPKNLLVFPGSATWGDEVLKAGKKIVKEGHHVRCIGVSDNHPSDAFDLLGYDKIITIDSAAIGVDGAKAWAVIERMLKDQGVEGLVEVVHRRCATASQILTRVKSEIRKSTPQN